MNKYNLQQQIIQANVTVSRLMIQSTVTSEVRVSGVNHHVNIPVEFQFHNDKTQIKPKTDEKGL